MANIASDFNTAKATITGLTSVSVQSGQQVTLGKSNITSLKTGATVNNQLTTSLSQLVSCVQKQSQKFPQLAEMMDIRDKQVKF